jgi:hypothetical protein
MKTSEITKKGSLREIPFFFPTTLFGEKNTAQFIARPDPKSLHISVGCWYHHKAQERGRNQPSNDSNTHPSPLF